MRRATVSSRQGSRVVKAVIELDAFPKVPENFKETSASGGGTSIVTFVFIIVLVIFELNYYSSTDLKFDYEVDKEVDGKLKINIDITVAMQCDLVGADILDQTGQDARKFGNLEMTNTYFKLSPNQQRYHDITKDVNRYLSQEYHAIQELLWLSGHPGGLVQGMPEREDHPQGQPDACRIHGSLEVNKVAGNFHITAGKSVPIFPKGHAHLAINMKPSGKPITPLTLLLLSYPHPNGHIHITGMVEKSDYNFSHRIDHFSFGERTGGIVNPLDGAEQVTSNNLHLFQYFVKIVPTQVRTYVNHIDTFQYSVTERGRPVDHQKGSHGVPGIFVKYDLSFLMIRVREEHKPYWQFLVRLCGIVGGIFVVSGLLHDCIGLLVDVLHCKFQLGKYKRESSSSSEKLPASETDKQTVRLQTNSEGPN